MTESELPPMEQLLASAAQYLVDGHEDDVASVLLASTLTLEFDNGGYSGNHYYRGYDAVLAGPRAVFDTLRTSEHIRAAIETALNAVMPTDMYIANVVPRVALVKLSPDWHNELLDIARGKNINNQGMTSDAVRTMTWQGLRFCSESERRIAEALDKYGVMYMANCKARLGLATRRVNRVPDFLICHEGKWGILEVDGEPFHPPSRKAQEDGKDRLLKAHGILVVEHFDATECYHTPDTVVKTFLDILKRS